MVQIHIRFNKEDIDTYPKVMQNILNTQKKY